MRSWRNILGWKEEKRFEPGARVRVNNMPDWSSSYSKQKVRNGDEGVLVKPYAAESWDVKFDNGRMYNGGNQFIAIRQDWLELI